MLLAIDVGNTNIVSGVFTGNDLDTVFRIHTNKSRTEDEYAADIIDILNLHHIDAAKIKKVIISSVVPLINEILKKAINLAFSCEAMFVSSTSETGLKICTEFPEKTGADLICGAAAAYDRYKTSVIVFDLGTATTVCAVDKKGNYLGHSIFPGVNVSLEALSQSAAQLPYINDICSCDRFIGKNTSESIKTGIVFGMASFIDGMTARYKSVLGADAVVVATGGLASVIISHCTVDIAEDKNLLLRGLNIIYRKNMAQQ